MPKKRKRCFVIMPFSKTSEEHTEEYWTEHFETFLKPLIEECPELEAHRSEPLRGDVLRQIITDLVVSPVVVADLTDRNPNVFWEVGVRQSFKHCTVTIAKEGTKIPFDVSVKGILYYYPKNHIKNAKFIRKFRKAITDCLSHPDSPDSHVLETVSGRGTLFEIIQRDEAARRVKALISECKWNIKLCNLVLKTANKNQKLRSGQKRKVVTRYLLSPALELLTTNRYLDKEDFFYELAEVCLYNVTSGNKQLAAWEQFPESTEKWFLRNAKKGKHVFTRLQKELNDIQKKLVAPY